MYTASLFPVVTGEVTYHRDKTVRLDLLVHLLSKLAPRLNLHTTGGVEAQQESSACKVE